MPRTLTIGGAVMAVLLLTSVAGRTWLYAPATALPAATAVVAPAALPALAAPTAPAASGADRLTQARAAAALGLRDRARSLLEEAVTLTPNDADAWNDLGVVRVLDGDVGGGIKALWRALDLDPRHADARRNLAAALEREAKADVTK